MAVTVDDLEIQIEASSSDAAANIERLASAFESLRTRIKGGAGLGAVTKQLQALANVSKQIDSSGIGKIREIVKGVQELGALSNVRISASIANQLTSLSQAIKNIQWTDGDKIEALANGLRPLTELGRSNLMSFINQLGKLPDVIERLDDVDLDKFATQIQRVTSAIGPLASEMNRVSAGFANFPARVQDVVSANNSLAASNVRTSKTFRLLNFGIVAAQAAAIGRAIGGFITKSNEYVESLNLFTVAMGDYADSAKDYADQVEAIMGIDPAEWLKAQGVFMTLATGFGVAADRAALMSKNLTQLGYDLSSFFNINVDEAMQKLQSGISGELEPLRRLGYDLSQARLEATALSLGIDKSVSSMTQTEKAQLRYYAILTQVTTAQGDMARTLEAPANQLRILKASVEQAARAIGNVFIPILNAVLPYVIAFVQVIEFAANALAELLGFELPSVDYSGIGSVTSGVGDLEDALDSAGGAAKKLKGQLAGFDEITIIGQQAGGGGGGAGGSSMGDGFDFELPEYDFLGDAVSGKVKQIFEDLMKYAKPVIDFLKDNFDTIWGLVKDIGLAIAAWKIGSALLDGAKKLVDYFAGGNEQLKGMIDRIGQIATGVLLITLGAKWSYEAGYEIGKGTAGVMDYIKAVLGPVAAGVGGMLITSALGLGGGIGFAIGITIGVAFLLAGIFDGMEAARVIDAFTEAANKGKVPVEDYINALAGALGEVSRVSGIVAGIGDTMAVEQEKIDNANIALETYFTTWKETGSIAAEEVQAISDTLGKLIDAIEEKGNLAATALQTTLGDALKGVSGETQELYGGLLKISYYLESGMNTTVAGWREELAKTEEQIRSLTPEMDGYEDLLASATERHYELWQKINGFNAGTSTATSELKDLNAQIEGLNFSGALKDADIAAEALTNLETATATAAKNVVGEYNTIMDSIDTLTKYVDVNSIEWRNAYQEAINLGLDESKTSITDVEGVAAFLKQAYGGIYQAQVDEILGIYDAGVSIIGDAFQGMLRDAAAQTLEGQRVTIWSKDEWAQFVLGTPEPVSYSELPPDTRQMIDDAIMGTWDDALDEAFKHLKKDESTNRLIGALENTFQLTEKDMSFILKAGTDMGEYLTEGSAEGVQNATSQAAARAGFEALAAIMDKEARNAFGIHSPAEIMIPSGEGLTEGVAEGINDTNSQGYITDAMEKLSDYLQSEFTNATSGVFEDEAHNLVSEIADGINYSSYEATNAMQSMLNEMLSSVESFSSRVASVMNQTVQNMANSMASVDISASGNVSFDRVYGASVSYFASGGFPEQGQMFIAREAGPELVGRIGGQTAVANNDQIVDGIAAGVQSANAEQNALLRRQNELLMALLEKESTVSLGKPSAEFGRFASRSMEKYSAVRG